ncbi:pre-mRNA-splicing helicase BRR2 [Nematocida sp. AWRm77]|nr:pre-mRNA-splicing helicase BRR2 [Nematocida sp. AWRm77]
MNKASDRIAKQFGISNEEAKAMLMDILKSDHSEEQLFDLLGEGHIAEIEELLLLKESGLAWRKHTISYLEEALEHAEDIKLQRNTTDVYDEYILECCTEKKEAERVSVKAISKKHRSVFREYTHFNVVQSLVFESVYLTEENVLVSAPTGAGKTDIALLAIVKHLEACEEAEGRGSTERGSKVVYIAPMKALAVEITHKLCKRLSVGVKEHTGDTALTAEEIEASTVLVCTPEKFDISIRYLSSPLLKQIGLVILDEVHILHSTRGPVIESIVARQKLHSMRGYGARAPRLLGISATLPNAEDVGEFLGVKKEHLHTFSREYRPVPISYSIIGMRKAIDQRSTLGAYVKSLEVRSRMLWVLQDRIAQFLRDKHQVIVFVHSRKDTEKVAAALAEETDPRELPEEEMESIEHMPEKLRDLYAKGVFIHHAGLPRETKLFAEASFKKKKTQVLVSTSTLAWGVNLPARAVIIFGTSFYSPETGRYEDVSFLDVQQMFGRAGRPQFDSKAEGILITTHLALPKYVKMLRTEDPLESMLLSALPEKLCTEVYLRNVRTHADVVEWLRMTFLWVRMQRRPEKYGTIFAGKETALEDYATLGVLRLQEHRMVDDQMNVTDMGRVLVHRSLTEETFVQWAELISPAALDPTLYLAEASEFQSLALRAEDAAGLGIRDPAIDVDRQMKIKILLKKHVLKQKVKGYALFLDQKHILENAERLLQALAEIALHRQVWVLANNALHLKQEIGDSKKKKDMLEIEAAVSPKQGMLLLSKHFTGYVYVKENKQIRSIEKVYATREVEVQEHGAEAVVSIVPVDRTQTFLGKVEVTPVRSFSDREVWLVDFSLRQIAGFVFTTEAAVHGTEGKRAHVPSLIAKEVTLHALPNVPPAELRAVLHGAVYESIASGKHASKDGVVVVVVPTEQEEGSMARRLTELAENSAEGGGVSFSGGGASKLRFHRYSASTIILPRSYPHTCLVASIQKAKQVKCARTYIFSGFTKSGVLYPPSVLGSLIYGPIHIYEKERECEYIRRRYLG